MFQPAGAIARFRVKISLPRRWPAFLALAAATAGAQPATIQRSGAAAAASAWQRYIAQSHAVLSALNRSDTAELPPAPGEATDIRFAEFFGPIGDRGLEYSEKLRALDDRIIRIAGYMVRESDRAPGVFRLAGWPLAVETNGPCAADTTPPSAVHVIVTAHSQRPVPYRPGKLILVGRLELGPRVEADGRNSVLRLILDAHSASAFTAAAEPSAR